MATNLHKSNSVSQKILVQHDIQKIVTLFATIQNIHIKGVVGVYGEEGAAKEWVTVEDIVRAMPRPKLKKPEIRDFCEYQAERGNLEKRVGKDKFVRQAEAEYKGSREGLKILAVFQGEEFQNIRNMYGWSRHTAKSDESS